MERQMMIGVYNHRNEKQGIQDPVPFSEGEPGSLGESNHHVVRENRPTKHIRWMLVVQ